MQPNIQLNFMAIGISVVATFIFGFIWYTPLFGKIWAKEMGFEMKEGEKPATSAMIRGMLFNVLGNFLLAFVFSHNIAVWYPETWGQPAIEGTTASGMAFMAALFTWLGFYVPVDLNSVAWEGRSWKLFFINTSYHFLTLLISALILNYMR